MRLDKYLSDKFNLTRSKTTDLIKLGQITVNNKIILKPSFKVKEEDEIFINEYFKYVSRAGNKLEQAIKHFNLDFNNKTVLDVGSSTGGFTQCSLDHGAKTIFAYDVGKNQMHDDLRVNPSIKLFEQTNILSVNPKHVDICLIDVSFTSIKPIINHLKDVAKVFVLLFKPQFEVGKKYNKNGIVKDEKIVNKSLDEFTVYLNSLNIQVRDYIKSDLKGKKGNQEYIFVGDRNVTTNKN